MSGISYNIDSINNGIARVSYSDGSWAEIVLESDMTAEQVDDLAYKYAPKTGTAPSFLTTGARTAVEMPVEQVDAPPLEDAWVDPATICSRRGGSLWLTGSANRIYYRKRSGCLANKSSADQSR